ncbi:9050_t:CDS:2 [Funneliformis mosseae]|uniref:9050_t:CDS:1 n=1 Tax=Funneliformis mosseae TaxID=27381 RepID=A0A9N9GSI1_FUNMO|nr:9050_t:CDS:2 [Funneliformis mosseae]
MLIHIFGVDSAESILSIESVEQWRFFLKTSNLLLFLKEININLHDKPFIIFIDEFDILLSSQYEAVCSSLLMKLRGIKSTTDIKLAKFLVSEGVLENADEPHTFKMTSTFMDLLVRKFVIPIICVLKRASDLSYKTAHMSIYYVNVPRESVHDTELNRILVNWLRYGHNYCDIVILPPITCQTSHNQPTIILELLSTTNKELREHFDRVQINFRRRESGTIWALRQFVRLRAGGLRIIKRYMSLVLGV